MKEKQLENKEEIMEINTWIKKKVEDVFLQSRTKKGGVEKQMRKEMRKVEIWSKRVNITNILDAKI